MNMEERERIRALEVKVDALTENVEVLTVTVRELRDMLVGARAVKWMLWILIPVGGFFIGLATRYFPYLPLPR